MRYFLGLLTLSLLSCSSTPQKLADTGPLPEFLFPVSLEKLKGLSIDHAESKFRADMKARRLDTEEITLRDFAFRYEGKVHPPLSTSMMGFPGMTKRRELAGIEIHKAVEGPVDIVKDSPKKFVLVYRNTAYVGERLEPGLSRLSILNTKPLETVNDEKGQFASESLILDLDRSLKESIRNRIAEWEILNGVDPDQAKEFSQKLGIEG